MKYYVYAYLDLKIEENILFEDILFKNRPIYIGKGKNNRIFSHFNDRKRYNTYFYNKLNKMILEENKPNAIKLKEFDSEEEALKMEIDLIYFLGRKKYGGMLYNMTNGGEGISGYRHTNDQREKMRNRCIKNESYKYFPNTKGVNHPMFGKKHRQSSIDKMIKSKLGTKQNKDWIEKRVSKLRGIPLSDEHKNKLSLFRIGKKASDATRKKQSLAKIGKEPHNKGKIKDIILQIDINRNIIKEWNNLNDLYDSGFEKSNVINVCTGKRKSHCGFIWKYKNDYENGTY